MVKKIIALSIALVLLLSAPMYEVIVKLTTPGSPVAFGAGDGESEVVATPAELQTLLSNIPDIESYLTTEDITTLKPDFKTFTMLEEGEAENVVYSYYQGGVKGVSTKVDHMLEMCFTKGALYYHATGTTTTTETIYGENQNWMSAERTVMSYDMEIYYSSTKVLLKFNDLDYVEQIQYSQGASWEEKHSDEDEPFSTTDQFAFFNKAGDKWLELVTYTDEELQEMFGDMSEPPTGEPDEEYVDNMLAYYALMYANEFAQVNIDAISATNQNNIAYLVRLATFLSENANTAFIQDGDRYMLSGSDSADAYLNAMFGTSDFNNKNIQSSFTINSTDAVIEQDWELAQGESYTPGRREVSMETTTTFTNVNNTVVTLKDESVTSVYNALKSSIISYLKDQMTNEEGE